MASQKTIDAHFLAVGKSIEQTPCLGERGCLIVCWTCFLANGIGRQDFSIRPAGRFYLEAVLCICCFGGIPLV